MRKGPRASARQARGRGGGRRGEAARKKRVLAELWGASQLQDVRAAASGRARCERGRAWVRAGPGVGTGRSGGRAGRRAGSGSGQAAAAAAPRARSPSLSGGVHGRPRSQRRSAPRWGWGRPGAGAERGPPGAAPPSCGPRRAAPAACGGGRRDPSARSPGCARGAREAGRAPSPPPAAGGRGRARREPAGECAGRELRARGARRGAAEPGRTPAPAPAAAAARVLPPALVPWTPACAESLIMKGKAALAPPASEPGAFVWGGMQTALSSPPPPGPKAMGARPGEAPKASSPSRSFELSTGKSCRRHCRGCSGRGGGCRCLCKFGFAGAPAPSFVTAAFGEP